MSELEPIEFIIGFDDFNTFGLPESAWEIGSDKFKAAVTAFYEEQFAPVGGTVTVEFDDRTIHVKWVPKHVSENPFGYAIRLLQVGELQKAVPLLKTFLAADPNNEQALYNLGMALSDLGKLDEAIAFLSRLVDLDPQHINGLVALGVAQQRAELPEQAVISLSHAVELAPNNPYAQRNLGAALASLGRNQAAEVHMREALRLQPADQMLLFGLAELLAETGDETKLIEADKLYRQAIDVNPHSEFAEDARRARSKFAEKNFRKKGFADLRPDAMFYCLDALQRFAKLSAAEVQAIAFEIALLGRTGLNVHDPATKYKLRAIPGEFSGLQLVSMMYVGFKQIAPEMDMGFDLSREYEAAKGIFFSDQP